MALPLLMAVVEVILTLETGFELPRAVFFTAISIGWFILYPKRFDQSVQKYAEKISAEPAYSKAFGPCTLTLTDEGLHSTSSLGTSTFTWDAVSHVALTDDYLHLFLGPLGYPIQIADIGRDAAEQAFAWVSQRRGASART